MKRYLLTFLTTIFVSSVVCSGGEMSVKLVSLKKIRDTKVLELDKQYLKAVEKLKLEYSRANDLESAIAAKEVTESLKKSIVAAEKRLGITSRLSGAKLKGQKAIEDFVVGHWLHPAGAGVVRFKQEGNADYLWYGSKSHSGKWVIKGDLIMVTWSNGKKTEFVIPRANDKELHENKGSPYKRKK